MIFIFFILFVMVRYIFLYGVWKIFIYKYMEYIEIYMYVYMDFWDYYLIKIKYLFLVF